MSNPAANAVQQKIGLEDIQDGTIILKDGGMRAVLMTTAINFSLKSAEEQEALIYKYQSFLNSLDFSIQIVIVSRQLDISGYLALLEQKRKEQENELLRVQASEYIDFVKNLVQMTRIMSQFFYIIVSIVPIEQKNQGITEKITSALKGSSVKPETKSREELKSQLWQRISYIETSLSSLGVKTSVLNTEEATELFYHLYNMGLKEKPTLTEEQRQG